MGALPPIKPKTSNKRLEVLDNQSLNTI